MSGCGGHCRCNDMALGSSTGVCDTPKEAIALNKEGKCPCGKEREECCHKEALVDMTPNDALNELCGPHGDSFLCGDDDDSKSKK